MTIDLSQAVVDIAFPSSRQDWVGSLDMIKDVGPFEPATVKGFSQVNNYGFYNCGRDVADGLISIDAIQRSGLKAVELKQPMLARVVHDKKVTLAAIAKPVICPAKAPNLSKASFHSIAAYDWSHSKTNHS